MKTKSRYRISRNILIFWTLFIGTGAVGGTLAMFIDPTGEKTGMCGLLPGLNKLPFADILFNDLLFSGIALLIVNGITNLCAATLLILNKKTGIILGGIFGITLMAWITIQFFIFESNFMSNIYFVFGILQALTGYATWVFYKQETYSFSPEDYKNVGKNDKVLIVFFSRMGYVKKLAFERAEKTGGKLLEITTGERTEGTLGFLWCGRFAMHKWDMPINQVAGDLSGYEKIIICTPVWAFNLAAPVRSFCRSAKNVKNAEYVICHFTRAHYNNVAKEMNELLGVEASEVTDVVCRFGKMHAMKKKSR